MKMEKKSFENWTFEDVEDVFGVERKHDTPLMVGSTTQA
jgi:hypothetical protein